MKRPFSHLKERRSLFGLSATLANRLVAFMKTVNSGDAEAAVGPSGLIPVRVERHQRSIYSPYIHLSPLFSQEH